MCPRVLVLHIKRFLFDRAAKIALKLNDSIALSATLDISRFCQEMKFCSPELAAASPTYKLRSFLNHIGEDNVGHYISYSRTNDDIWFCVFCAALEMPGAGFAKTILMSTKSQRQMPFLLPKTLIYILFFEVSFTDPVVQFVCISWISSICLHHLHQLKSQFSAMSREMCSSQR